MKRFSLIFLASSAILPSNNDTVIVNSPDGTRVELIKMNNYSFNFDIDGYPRINKCFIIAHPQKSPPYLLNWKSSYVTITMDDHCIILNWIDDQNKFKEFIIDPQFKSPFFKNCLIAQETNKFNRKKLIEEIKNNAIQEITKGVEHCTIKE